MRLMAWNLVDCNSYYNSQPGTPQNTLYFFRDSVAQTPGQTLGLERDCGVHRLGADLYGTFQHLSFAPLGPGSQPNPNPGPNNNPNNPNPNPTPTQSQPQSQQQSQQQSQPNPNNNPNNLIGPTGANRGHPGPNNRNASTHSSLATFLIRKWYHQNNLMNGFQTRSWPPTATQFP